jgi:hypothetical protein
MKNDHTWRGMLIKDNEGDWGICVAAWRGMKKGKAGVAGNTYKRSARTHHVHLDVPYPFVFSQT